VEILQRHRSSPCEGILWETSVTSSAASAARSRHTVPHCNYKIQARCVLHARHYRGPADDPARATVRRRASACLRPTMGHLPDVLRHARAKRLNPQFQSHYRTHAVMFRVPAPFSFH
jgi:hypothetical protein